MKIGEKIQLYVENADTYSVTTGDDVVSIDSRLAPEIQVFQNVLNKFYSGKKDQKTLEILKLD